jgi:hypothetical protein
VTVLISPMSFEDPLIATDLKGPALRTGVALTPVKI